MREKLNNLSHKDFIKEIAPLSEADLATLAPNLTPEKFTSLLIFSCEKEIPRFLKEITNKEQLELVGKTLSFDKLLGLFDELAEENISPLLVGMDQEKFEQILLKMNDQQLEILKREGLSEPVFHHMHALVHHLEQENVHFIQKLNTIEALIDSIDPNLTTKEEVHEMIQSIRDCQAEMDLDASKLKQALAIAWSIGSLPLIEKLTTINTSMQRIKVDVIGSLPALLEAKLFSIYGDPSNDKEPATEGLSHFGVWYLENYWDLGLLPAESKRDNLSQHERDALFQQVEKNLEKIGLKTIKNLKEALIFSKQTLKEYIEARDGLL